MPHSTSLSNECKSTAGMVAAGVGTEASTVAILQALARASVMFVLFFGFRAVYRTLRGVEGMGFGDVQAQPQIAAGVWLDWASLPIAVETAALSALAAALYARLRVYLRICSRGEAILSFSRADLASATSPS